MDAAGAPRKEIFFRTAGALVFGSLVDLRMVAVGLGADGYRAAELPVKMAKYCSSGPTNAPLSPIS